MPTGLYQLRSIPQLILAITAAESHMILHRRPKFQLPTLKGIASLCHLQIPVRYPVGTITSSHIVLLKYLFVGFLM